MDADEVPHTGRVYVDYDSNDRIWYLTHVDTQEKVARPPSDGYQLAFDADGFAYVASDNSSDGAEVDVNEYFSLRLVQLAESGRQAVLHAIQRNDLEYLDSAVIRVQHRLISLRAGPTIARDHLNVAVFDRRRSGFRTFFSLVDIYQLLGMRVFSNCASRWAWQMLPSFSKHVSQVIPGQALRSLAFMQPVDGDPDALRCLPFHAV